MSLKRELEVQNRKLNIENVKLKKTIKNLSSKSIPKHLIFPKKRDGVHVRHGLISDTHIGSIYNNIELLHKLYDIFKSEGIKTVYHCGDITDGEKVYRGHDYELYAIGARAQADTVIEKYPKIKGITTYFITGNHDLSFYKRAGIDVGELISSERKDLVYLGQEDADVFVGSSGMKVKMKLVHPGGGTAYAISYKAQKIAESFSGGRKPNLLYMGHFHKAELLPCQRNIQIVQAGCIQKQTPFMARGFMASHQGGWLIDFLIDKKFSVGEFCGQFIPYYEKSEYKSL